MLFVTLTDVTPAASMRRSLEQLLDLSQQLSTGATPVDVAKAVCRTAVGCSTAPVASFWSVRDHEIAPRVARAANGCANRVGVSPSTRSSPT